jgi:F-type H+-transporting ATPase subunit a
MSTGLRAQLVLAVLVGIVLGLGLGPPLVAQEHAAPAAVPQAAPQQPADAAHDPPPAAAHATPPAAHEAAHQAGSHTDPSHAAGDDADHDAPLSSAQIFLQLYKHLEPHAVSAVWFGGNRGFGIVPAYPTDAAGEPLALDSHQHPVSFHSTAELNAFGSQAYGGGFGVLIYNVNTASWIAAALVIVVFVSLARGAVRRGVDAPKGGVYNIFESLVLFVRDEMVYKVMGSHHGRRLVPLFLTQFVFILAMNLLGLVYLPGGVGGTATANLGITAGMALTTLIWINLAGMREHGVVGYAKSYAPHGLPLFVLPLLVVIELASNLLIKPAALTIRLFANMTAGHLVMLSLFGLVYLAGTMMAGFPSLLAMGFAVGICLLEVMVAFIQAYIFTYLSIVFIGASVHPEH